MADTQQDAGLPTVEPKGLACDAVGAAGVEAGMESGADSTLEFKPIEKPNLDPLAGLAIDADELAGRIHDGQGTDINALIERSLSERAA